LALPHIVWLALWTIAAIVVAIIVWIATLFTGRPPRALHAFLSHYVRYQLHVSAFIYLAANPFPGFDGREGVYPLDLVLPPAGRPSRRTRCNELAPRAASPGARRTGSRVGGVRVAPLAVEGSGLAPPSASRPAAVLLCDAAAHDLLVLAHRRCALGRWADRP